jgi:hypothetical protein
MSRFSARRRNWQYSYDAALPNRKKPTAQFVALPGFPEGGTLGVSIALEDIKSFWRDHGHTTYDEAEATSAEAAGDTRQKGIACAGRRGYVLEVVGLDGGHSIG